MDDNELTAEEQAALDAQRSAPEPEAPAQPAPEVPQEGAEGGEAPGPVEQAADKGEPPVVPYERFKEANDRRKETERELAELRRKSEARFEELLKLVPQPAAQQPEAPQAPAIPDVQADPVGHIVGTLQQLGASQQQIQQRVEQFQQQQQLMQIRAAIRQRAQAAEAVYRQEVPDYNDALDYLRGVRDRQLAVITPDPAMRAAQIEQEYEQISAHALQQGISPADIVYKMAKASGYAPSAPQSMSSEINDAARQTLAAPDPAARLRTVQQGQEHARGLGGVRGNGPSPMTAAKLLDMDDDAFLEAMKKSKDARKLMGA